MNAVAQGGGGQAIAFELGIQRIDDHIDRFETAQGGAIEGSVAGESQAGGEHQKGKQPFVHTRIVRDTILRTGAATCER